MRVSPLTSLCPAAGTSYAPPPGPHPKGRTRGGPGLSFTLPGDIRSASIARTATAVALKANGLTAYVWPVSHAVNELVSVTARLTPGRELYVSLRHREDAVRLLVWDQHPHHVEPDTAALCEVRRRRALWLLAAVVDDWGGEWGMCEAPQPMRGSKSWVELPR
ncbi:MULTISPECIES: ATP-binding protein [unclassified Streptomyces]|uniref:ATP-binding protein n=1 Tax=unclassified Streptomyces TaxID=2593676 RepID=UPI000DACF248|nr:MULTISPECIES: ATP-binding protein [unclassified Streptomyces]PZT76381.1 ATP-binding protein [Streptomyces sp. AC1-42W]PZT79665.1 ATP-binding protein [Streptomyces sp. AC1-42T]